MLEFQTKAIYIAGDIHGDLASIVQVNKAITDSIFIQVGDFGVGFVNEKKQNHILTALNTVLREKNNILLTIAGNHDNKEYFRGNHIFSHLKLLPDYTYVQINDLIYLFVGGAISIDRIARTLHVDYWLDEGVELKEELLNQECDVLITHTKMTNQYPYTFSSLVLGMNDAENKMFPDKPTDSLLDEIKIENYLIDRIFDAVKPKYHFYGHFHDSKVGFIKNCEWKLLDINEIVTFRPKKIVI